MFIQYLLRNNFANKLYMLGFVVAVIAYTFWKQTEDMLNFSEENEGAIYFIGIAFSFCCYTSAYLLTKWDKWRWFPMLAFLVCVSRFIKEIYLLYYPSKVAPYDYFDYFNFLLTIYIVFGYYTKHQHEKYKKQKNK